MRSGEGTTICWEGAQQASPALLIHSPFFREELEMREDKMLLGGCVYFESATKLSVFPCSLQGQLWHWGCRISSGGGCYHVSLPSHSD